MAECVEPGCTNLAEPDRGPECFRHRVLGVGVTYKSGAGYGRASWGTSLKDHMQQSFGVDSGKELARTNPNIERYEG